MKRIYLIRHGESEANHKGIKQDANDPLSERGREQARFLAHRVERLPIDVVIASPYARTRETAEIILEHLKKPIEWRDDIVEKGTPSEIVGLPYENAKVMEVLRLTLENHKNHDWRYSDEESFAEFRARAQSFLRHLESRTEDHILVVSHGAYLRMLLALLIFGNDATHEQFGKTFLLFRNENTGISVLGYTKEHGWLLQTWNDHAHLS